MKEEAKRIKYEFYPHGRRVIKLLISNCTPEDIRYWKGVLVEYDKTIYDGLIRP